MAEGLLRGLYVDVDANYTGAVAGLEAVDRAGDNAGRSLRNVEERADRANKRMKAIRGTFYATTAATVGLVAGLGALVKRYGSVGETFARVRARGQLSNETMNEMRQTGAQLGAELPSTLSDSANAMDALQKAGFSADQTMDSLRGTTLLAIAGQMSMKDAAKVTTSVLNAWQLQASRANSIADTLASTSSTTSADVRGLGDSLSYASSTAAQVGATSDEIAAWSGILSNAGQEGTRAGTAIRQALNKIIDPTEEMKSALGEVGLTVDDFYDKSGELKDVETIVSLLNSSMGDLSDQERSQLLSQMFGIRGQSAIAPLLKQSEEFSKTLNTSFSASIAGAIDRLNKLNDTELKSLRQSVGFKLEQGSTKEIIQQFREQANKQDWSQADLTKRLQSGLDISHEAAVRLAVDVGGDTQISKIVDTLDKASTSGEQAQAVMNTLSGRIERLTGSMDAFFSNVYRGAAGPLSFLLGILNPIAGALSQNKTAAKVFGVALVGLTGVLGTIAALTGTYIAYQKSMVAWQYAQEGATLVNAAAQNALSASYWRTQAAAVANRVSSAALTTARYAGRAAALASAGGEWALAAARNSPATLTAYAREGTLTSARYAGRVAAYSTAAGEWALDTARAAGGALLAAGYEATLTGARYAGRAAAYAGRASELALLGARKGGRAAGMAVAGAEYALTAARNSSVATAIAAKASSFGLGAARSAGRAYALGTAGAEWALTAARESSTAAAISSRVATVAGTAALAAQQGVAYATAAGQYALATASGVLSGGLYAAAAGAWALLAPFWPILAVGAGVAALALAIKTNFLGLGDAAGFVASSLGGLVGWLGNIAGWAGGGILNSLSAGFHAVTNPIDTVRSGIQWLLDKIPSLPGPKDIPLLGGAIDFAGDLLGGQKKKGQKAGQQLADGVAKGAKKNKGKAGKAAGQVAGEMDKRMPHSPAQKGPLANLGQVGSGLINTVASGLHKDKGKAGGAASSVAQMIQQAFGGMNPQVSTPQVGKPTVPRPEGKPPKKKSLTPNQQPQTVVQGVAQQVRSRELRPERQPQATVGAQAQRTAPGEHEPTRQPRTVVGAAAQRSTARDHQPRQQPQTTVEARSGQTQLDDFTPGRQPQVSVQGEGRPPSPQSLTPNTGISTVIDAVAGSTPDLGGLLPGGGDLQTTIDAVAKRAQATDFNPSRQPTATVRGEAQAPPREALTPDAPSAVIDAITGSIPDPTSLIPGGVGNQLQASIGGVVNQLGLSDEVSAMQSALAPAESAAGRIAGTLHGGARSAATAITDARPPGLNASVQVGEAPSRIPVDASGVAAALPGQQSDRSNARTVGQATTTQAQRPTAPPTTQSPDGPVSAPGLGGAGGQPATVGAAAAGDTDREKAPQTVGDMARSQRQQEATGENAPPTVTGDVPPSRSGSDQSGPRPMPPSQRGDSSGMGGAGSIDASTIIQNLNVGDPNSTPREEMRGHVQQEVGRAFQGRVGEVVDVVMARLYDAADTREQTQGPGTAQG